jgi:hypothetical protein
VTTLPTRRVLVHVGAPKTGTSFVQDTLFDHRDALREHGILYAADRHDAHFLAALDLMQLPWGGLEREAAGRWEWLAAQVRSHEGTAIISHEILGTASRVQVAHALESLGGPDTEIHVIYSARDLVRQIPAEWQENVKHRRTKTYTRFLEDLREQERTAEVAQWFWGVQEVPDVLDRWAGTLPPERVHVVTVPPAGSERGLLWQRFVQVLGLEPAGLTPTARANASLGVPEATMVRRLNTRLNDVLAGPGYRRFVRELLVHENLSGRRSSPRLSLPPDVHAWATELARTWVEELARRGYDVVGDLQDLVPGAAPAPYADPESCDEHDVAEAALDSLALMTIEASRLRDVEVELHGVIEDLTDQLDRFYGTRTYKAKERLVALSRRNVVARGALAAYRRLRGSSSRST